jgi:hypothetical protein
MRAGTAEGFEIPDVELAARKFRARDREKVVRPRNLQLRLSG